MKAVGWKRRTGLEYIQKFKDVTSQAQREDNGPRDADKNWGSVDLSYGTERVLLSRDGYKKRITVLSTSEESGARVEQKLEIRESGGGRHYISESETVTSTPVGGSENITDTWERKMTVDSRFGIIEQETPLSKSEFTASDWFITPQD